MVDQERIFLAELRLCGESNHWRVDARYTGAEKKEADSGDSAAQQGQDEKKKSSVPEEIQLSILVPAGDRSVVDLQIDAMERAIALLQVTVGLARQEQVRGAQAARA